MTITKRSNKTRKNEKKGNLQEKVEILTKRGDMGKMDRYKKKREKRQMRNSKSRCFFRELPGGVRQQDRHSQLASEFFW